MPDRLARLAHEWCASGTPVLVLSPHLDDAVLSCGALLAHLVPHCPVTVATVFTEAAPPPWSLPARRQLRAVGMDAGTLFERRRAEDRAVLGDLGVAAVHLGLRDALFRRVGVDAAGPAAPGRRPTYPTWRFDAARGRVARTDAGLAAEVAGRAGALTGSGPGAVVLAPLGVGRHVDHLITRGAAERIAARTVFYSDFPYSERAAPEARFVRHAALTPHPWLAGRAANSRRIAGYRSQLTGLFPDGRIPVRPEVYWLGAHDPAAAS